MLSYINNKYQELCCGSERGTTLVEILPSCCRAEWEVLEISIGEVDEPFQVTLVYTSCLWKKGLTVALDSLEFVDCESGESPCPVMTVKSQWCSSTAAPDKKKNQSSFRL